MAKSPTFSCANCGATHSKWSGRCDDCGAWNTISEDTPLSEGPAKSGLGQARGKAITLTTLSSDDAPPPRTLSTTAPSARPSAQRSHFSSSHSSSPSSLAFMGPKFNAISVNADCR